MKNNLTIILLLFLINICTSQTFSDFIIDLENKEVHLRQAKVDSFMQVTVSFPVTEDSLAHFIYKGSGGSVTVPGDFSGWDPSKAPMTNVGNTNFWYRTEIFDPAARLDYKFNYNGNVWILDPRNPFQAPGGFGNNSEIRMPDYVAPEEIKYFSEIPHGSLQDTIYTSTNMGNSRKISVYLPPGYAEKTDTYPVVLVHDGLEYISFAKMNNVIDYLISEKLIQPLIAVFVPPISSDRSKEYIDSKQNAFTAFITEEVMPWVDSKYRTKLEPSKRMVMGSSAGGNISLWLSMNHPEVFGLVAPFSPFIENDIQQYFTISDRIDLRIFMIHGKYDHLNAIHSSVNSFLPIIEAKGYDYRYAEYPEGHSYGFWRAYIDEALIFFFPAEPTSIAAKNEIPLGFNLLQNFPNPFNPSTTISFNLQKSAKVEIKIFSVLGELIYTYSPSPGRVYAGEFHFVWNALNNREINVPSGIYFYTLFIDGQNSQTRKMILIR